MGHEKKVPSKLNHIKLLLIHCKILCGNIGKVRKITTLHSNYFARIKVTIVLLFFFFLVFLDR